MTKDQRTIKQLTAQVTDLTSKVSRLESSQHYREQSDNELAGIHATFDLMGVPRRVKNTYRDLSANTRLTLFLAQSNGITVEQPKEE